MRTIYLIRHSRPDFPDGKKMCIGKTDLPLGAVGRMQSVLLAEGLKDREISAVYCSDLKRSIQTASYLGKESVSKSGFQEFGCGDWDGRTFEEIKEKWPEIYELRGKDLSCPIPGAQSEEEGRQQFEKTLLEVLGQSEGDIAIVGHATANQSFLCGIRGIDPKLHRIIPMDYASVTTLGFDGTFSVSKENEVFVPELTEALCKKLLEAAGTPEPVQAHCMAVKNQAKRISSALKEAGVVLNESLLETAAMLHDVARTEKEHAKMGGDWIDQIGYPKQGNIIRAHHDRSFSLEEIDEKAVLVMADRCVKETEVVSVEERFLESKKKCKTKETLKMHQERYLHTLRLKDRIHEICGKEIIL